MYRFCFRTGGHLGGALVKLLEDQWFDRKSECISAQGLARPLITFAPFDTAHCHGIPCLVALAMTMHICLLVGAVTVSCTSVFECACVVAAKSCGLGVANVFVFGLVATSHGTTLRCAQDCHSLENHG